MNKIDIYILLSYSYSRVMATINDLPNEILKEIAVKAGLDARALAHTNKTMLSKIDYAPIEASRIKTLFKIMNKDTTTIGKASLLALEGKTLSEVFVIKIPYKRVIIKSDKVINHYVWTYEKHPPLYELYNLVVNVPIIFYALQGHIKGHIVDVKIQDNCLIIETKSTNVSFGIQASSPFNADEEQ